MKFDEELGVKVRNMNETRNGQNEIWLCMRKLKPKLRILTKRTDERCVNLQSKISFDKFDRYETNKDEDEHSRPKSGSSSHPNSLYFLFEQENTLTKPKKNMVIAFYKISKFFCLKRFVIKHKLVLEETF